MSSVDCTDYVRQALALQGYPADAIPLDAIALQFSRIQTIAATFLDATLEMGDEPAPVFRL